MNTWLVFPPVRRSGRASVEPDRLGYEPRSGASSLVNRMTSRFRSLSSSSARQSRASSGGAGETRGRGRSQSSRRRIASGREERAA